MIRKPKDQTCPNLEGKFPTLDATRISVSRSNGQRSGLEAGGGVPCRPNPAATLLVLYVLINNNNGIRSMFVILVIGTRCLVISLSQRFRSLGFCRAMLCISAAKAGNPGMPCLSVCPSVCLSVTFVSCAERKKDIFKIFSPSGSPTILVFPYQTG